MTALLPPPGGPLPQAERVRTLLAAARERLEIARERLQRVRGYQADELADDVDQMHTRILLAVRDRECELWAAEVARLELLADRMSIIGGIVR